MSYLSNCEPTFWKIVQANDRYELKVELSIILPSTVEDWLNDLPYHNWTLDKFPYASLDLVNKITRKCLLVICRQIPSISSGNPQRNTPTSVSLI